MNYDFIRFDWPNMSFIATLAIIPIAVVLATPTLNLKHQQASLTAVSMSVPDAPVIID